MIFWAFSLAADMAAAEVGDALEKSERLRLRSREAMVGEKFDLFSIRDKR